MEEELEEKVKKINIQLENFKKMLGIVLDKRLMDILFVNLNMRCKKLYWKTEYGLANPALTGILNGFIWILKGVFIRLVDEIILFTNKPKLSVEPDFYNQKISTYFIGIFSMRIVNIIITAVKVLIYKLGSKINSKDFFSLKSR